MLRPVLRRVVRMLKYKIRRANLRNRLPLHLKKKNKKRKKRSKRLLYKKKHLQKRKNARRKILIVQYLYETFLFKLVRLSSKSFFHVMGSFILSK
jgi:hypothetical protein